MANVAVQDGEQASVSTAAAAPTTKRKKVPTKLVHLGIETILLIAVVVLGLLVWNASTDKKNLQRQLASVQANPQALVQQQTNQLISQVGALIDLPTGETPTIAAVTNVDAAKKQSAFFDNAQNGDKVLLYVKAGKAILYRPSTNKIIESQPLTINNSAATTSTGTTGSTTTTTKKP